MLIDGIPGRQTARRCGPAEATRPALHFMLVLLFSLFAVASAIAAPLPALTGRVVDDAHMIDVMNPHGAHLLQEIYKRGGLETTTRRWYRVMSWSGPSARLNFNKCPSRCWYTPDYR